jgi:hypothetical protein
MTHMVRWLAFSLLVLPVAACQGTAGDLGLGAKNDPAGRGVVFHTHVAGARFWLDGARVPSIDVTTDADGNTPLFSLPASLTAFNVHASHAGYPEYGVVAQVSAAATPLEGFFGPCAGGCSSATSEVFVGPGWSPDATPADAGATAFTRAQILDTQGDLMIWGGPEFALDCSTGQDPETGIRCQGDNGGVPRGLQAGWVWSLSLPRYPAPRREALYQKVLGYGYTHVAIQVTKCVPGDGYHGLYPTTAQDCSGNGALLNTVLQELKDHHLIAWCTGLTQNDPPEDGLDRSLCPAVLDDWDNTDQKDCHLQAMASWFPDALIWVEMPQGTITAKPDACSPTPFPQTGGEWIRQAQQRAPNFVGVAYELNEPDGHAANLAELDTLNAWWRDLQQNRFEIDTYWKFWDGYGFDESRVYNDWFLTNAPWLHGFMSGGTTHAPTTLPPFSGGIVGELDLSQVTLEHMASDFASWPITTHIKKVTLSLTGVSVELDNGRPDSWPDTADRPGMGPLLYSLGLAEKINGQWYASAPIQLWRGLAESGGPIQDQDVDSSGQGQIAKNWFYDSRWGPLAGHQVLTGDELGIFVCAGDCRDGVGDYSPVHERSNVVLINLPGAQGGVFQ